MYPVIRKLDRDLVYLTKRDYLVKKMQPVDMFPVTDSVESSASWKTAEPSGETKRRESLTKNTILSREKYD